MDRHRHMWPPAMQLVGLSESYMLTSKLCGHTALAVDPMFHEHVAPFSQVSSSIVSTDDDSTYAYPDLRSSVSS